MKYSVVQAGKGLLLAGIVAAALMLAGCSAAQSEAASLSDDITRALQASYASAAHVAANNPASAAQILEAARLSFIDGAWAAYLVGGVALVLGLIVVAVGLPTVAVEKELRGRYRDEDALTAP